MPKKRANGEGSIRKKPNGRWEGRYTQGIDPKTGRAIQKSVSARTQAECKEKLARAIRDTYTHITSEMQRGAAEKIGGFMETATAKPEPEPPDPPEGSRCKVIPFKRVG